MSKVDLTCMGDTECSFMDTETGEISHAPLPPVSPLPPPGCAEITQPDGTVEWVSYEQVKAMVDAIPRSWWQKLRRAGSEPV